MDARTEDVATREAAGNAVPEVSSDDPAGAPDVSADHELAACEQPRMATQSVADEEANAFAPSSAATEWADVYNEETQMFERVPLGEAYRRSLMAMSALQQELRRLQEAQHSADDTVWREQARKQWERADDFQGYTVSVFKTTLDNATRTYKLITTMSKVMFAVGIGLLLLAALYATFADEKALSLAFAGLGISTFVAIFILGPIDKAQIALSNLVQAEVGFMTAFEQIRMLADYAWTDGRLDPKKAEKASKLLHEHAKETMELLQRYIETKVETPD